MGHTLGLALQGRFNDPVPLVLRIVHFAPATRSDLPDLPDALLVHTLAPKLHRGPAHAESLGDRYILLTRHRSQDNSAAQRHLLRRPVRGFPLFQLCALRRLQLDLQTFVRHDWDHTKHWNYVKLFMGHYTRFAKLGCEIRQHPLHNFFSALNLLLVCRHIKPPWLSAFPSS